MRRRRTAPRKVEHRIREIETDQESIRIARRELAQRIAGAAARVEDRQRLQLHQ